MKDNIPDQNDPEVLLIEDSMSHAMIYTSYLAKLNLQTTHVKTGSEGLAYIKQHTPTLVMLDLELPDIHGMSILKFIVEQHLPCIAVILTGHGTINLAVEAMQSGAFDFLTKPFDANRFNETVRNALEHYRLNGHLWEHRHDVERTQYCNFIGASDAMKMVYQMIDNVATSNASVFICGESGTGKELCAEAIHHVSPRKGKPFIALNCASIPKELMESEFFGHVKGAFTGALQERTGAVEQADGGTLFLDEICEMDLELQSKLLRFIQTGRYRKVGSSKEKQVDIRFVCATNRSPLKEVTKGNFREDLYYRLHVIPINLPPLRERDHDVLLIAKHLLKKYATEENRNIKGFTPDAEQVLLKYQWPGNVRQMQNVIRLIVVLNNVELITRQMLPAPLNDPALTSEPNTNPTITSATAQQDVITIPNQQSEPNVQDVAHGLLNQQPAAGTDNTSLEEPLTDLEPHMMFRRKDDIGFSAKEKIKPFEVYERKIIEAAISSCDGNVPEAAAQLALSPSTLYRKIQVWKSKKV